MTILVVVDSGHFGPGLSIWCFGCELFGWRWKGKTFESARITMLDCTCTKQITSMNLVPMNYELLDIQLMDTSFLHQLLNITLNPIVLIYLLNVVVDSKSASVNVVPQIAWAIGVLTSSIGVRVRRFLDSFWGGVGQGVARGVVWMCAWVRVRRFLDSLWGGLAPRFVKEC